MINIIIEDKEIPIKNLVTEFTIGEFEIITNIINDETENSLTRWSKVMKFLGLSEDVIDNFDTFDFMKIIEEFNEIKTQTYNYVETINILGEDYKIKLIDGELRLTVKEMRIIENFVKKDSKVYIANVLAVIYKREDIQKELQYDDAHIKYKSELISKHITADIALPIMGFLSKKLTKDTEIINGTT